MKFWHVVLISCSILLQACFLKGNKEDVNRFSNSINIELEALTFPKSAVLNQKSYYLSDTYDSDTSSFLIGYNYQLHQLDCFNLSDLSSYSVRLENDGPNRILRPYGMYVQNMDSIWMYDESGTVSLVNKLGEVIYNVKLREWLEKNEEPKIETNYAISTATFHYDNENQSLLFVVKDRNYTPAKFKVKEVFFHRKEAAKEYFLDFPDGISDICNGDYGNMDAPNVTFANNKIIYNYPISSDFFVIDYATGNTKKYKAPSVFSKNKVEKLKKLEDYAEWEKHAITNPHFYELIHLADAGVYIRLHVGEQAIDASKSVLEQFDSRSLFLMCWDDDFNYLGEVQLTSNRYSLYTGWIGTDKYLIIYVDNSLLDSAIVNSENLIIDRVLFKKQ